MTIAAPDFSRFIEKHFPLQVVPSVPELRLRLAAQNSGLGAFLAAHGIKRAPYWAYAWGGGLALARYLLDRPDFVAGRSVLDIGTGSGLVAIAAARCGAATVMAIDVDPLALEAAQLNARENGVKIETGSLEGQDLNPSAYQVVLAGDVFYDAGIAQTSLALLDRFLSAGAEVLVGDPGRVDLPLHRLEEMATFQIADFGGRTGNGMGTVYRLTAAKD